VATARRRRVTGHWLSLRGSGDRPLPRDVSADPLDRFSSTKQPSVEPGDLVVFYASVWKVIFATGEVVGVPEYDPSRTRWGWRIPTRPILRINDLAQAPPVESAGVLPRSLGRHSHIRLTEEQYDDARLSIAGAMDPVDLVAAGYDEMTDTYHAWQKRIQGSQRLAWLDRLLERLPERPEVLELGSGAGVRSTRVLAERGRLVGIDVSAEQVRRARERVPGVEFHIGDYLEVEFPRASFDGVVAFYTLTHVPRSELSALLARVARWLRPGGHFLATFGTVDHDDVIQDEWLGVPMFFSGMTPAQNAAIVRAVGLEVVAEEVEEIVEPDGPARFHWILARKP
jgi:SAM-dependent methyltransferase